MYLLQGLSTLTTRPCPPHTGQLSGVLSCAEHHGSHFILIFTLYSLSAKGSMRDKLSIISTFPHVPGIHHHSQTKICKQTRGPSRAHKQERAEVRTEKEKGRWLTLQIKPRASHLLSEIELPRVHPRPGHKRHSSAGGRRLGAKQGGRAPSPRAKAGHNTYLFLHKSGKRVPKSISWV